MQGGEDGVVELQDRLACIGPNRLPDKLLCPHRLECSAAESGIWSAAGAGRRARLLNLRLRVIMTFRRGAVDREGRAVDRIDSYCVGALASLFSPVVASEMRESRAHGLTPTLAPMLGVGVPRGRGSLGRATGTRTDLVVPGLPTRLLSRLLLLYWKITEALPPRPYRCVESSSLRTLICIPSAPRSVFNPP